MALAKVSYEESGSLPQDRSQTEDTMLSDFGSRSGLILTTWALSTGDLAMKHHRSGLGLVKFWAEAGTVKF